MTILGLVGDRPRDGKNPRVFLENIGAHTLLIGGRIGVGTPHSIERKSLAVGGWVVGWGWSKLDHKATLWLHLAS